MKQAPLVALALLAGCGPVGGTPSLRGQRVSTIAVGGAHACGVVEDSATVRCFGSNAEGQLGDGTQVDRREPTLVPGLTGAVELAAGAAHTCARLDDGTVRCFGANASGQLGDGSTQRRTTPIVVPAVAGARAIAAGGAHTCAILPDRTVACWGANDFGQLGDGATTARATPFVVPGLGDVEALALGIAHTCVRLVSGAVRCFGRNVEGQIGDGTVDTPRRVATAVVGLADARDLAAGLVDTCVVASDGTLRCWGAANARAVPTQVIGWDALERVSIGASSAGSHVCALRSDRTVRCAIGSASPPALVAGIVDAEQIEVGASFACVRRADGSVRCFAPGEAPQPVLF